MKNHIGFGSGIILGIAATILAQQLLLRPESAPAPAEPERGSLASRRQDQLLANARERIAELEDRLANGQPADQGTTAPGAEATAAAAGGAADKAAAFVKMMMSFGDDDAIRKIDEEVARLSGILDLTGDQQDVVRDALMKKFKLQKDAGVRLMTGSASIGDLLAADEHNFSAVDAAIQPILDGPQLELYQGEQAAREQQRIENKTREELDRLASAAELSAEQQDAAWEILAEINAAELPGQIPEGTGAAEFFGFIDSAIDKRIAGLAPLLSEQQAEIYQAQTQQFRDKIFTLVEQAIDSGATSSGVLDQP